jgi:LPS-assembly protein
VQPYPVLRPRYSLSTLLLKGVALGGLLQLHTLVQAQDSPVVLRSSPLLEERISLRQNQEGAVFVSGRRLVMQPDLNTVLEGDARLRKPGLSMRADRLVYDQSQDVLEGYGAIQLNRPGSQFHGTTLNLKVDSFQGALAEPRFEIFANGGHGQASRLEFIDPSRAVVHQATYTTCRRTPGPDWLPAWLLKATRMNIDDEESTVKAEGVKVRFQNLPEVSIPAVSFPLTADRRSGFLPPIVGVTSRDGSEIVQPYYFDLAPNRDATVTTHVMSKRGVAVDTEFRYLERGYSGQARLNLMPSDTLSDQARWGWSSQHSGSIQTGIEGIGAIGLGLNLNRVSDDNYWSDFRRSGLVLTQRLLPSTGVLNWGRGGFNMSARVLRFQPLQDIRSTIIPPYNLTPQIGMTYAKWQADGFDWSVQADTTRFEADFSRIPNFMGRNGERSYVQTQLSRPWIRPWGFFTPKVQLHATRYQLDQPMDNGSVVANRVLPTFSLDSGLVVERDASWFGRSVAQTLEPRAFYAKTPFKDQSMLPVYDSGLTDFNLSTIYSEKTFVGNDRLIDNDALTLGVSSRFFDAVNGAELLRLGLAQRIRFSDQRVLLNSSQLPATTGLSDLLVGAGVRWDNRWALDNTVQINNQTNDISRNTLQLRYYPSPYRVLNAAYRLNRGLSEQLDIGWQWPLSDLVRRRNTASESAWTRTAGQGLGPDRWFTVGRMNISLTEGRMVESLMGLEYDAGCWIGRIVFESNQHTIATTNTRLFFQLELIGLGRVGPSPLAVLRNNIPRYQKLRDNPLQPSRFQNYE